MYADDVKLGSVNWERGMLLQPEHFIRQERYFDSKLLWLLRYATTSYGLIGGGARLPELERGAQGDDPAVSVSDDGDALSITVQQCRGITPGGCLVDISRERSLFIEIPKRDLEGVAESRIYIVCNPHKKEIVEGEQDELNPDKEPECHSAYRIALKVAPEDIPYAIAVGLIVRAPDGVEFDRDAEFIPACAFMDAHSELAAAARRIIEEVIALASRFTELHRAMGQFIALFKDRGIETEIDLESMTFVGRMVVELQNCVYEIVDTRQPPQTFFGHLRRFIHSAAVYLDLSPPVRQYFLLLKESGETEFVTLLGQQRKLLSASPRWQIHEDLSLEVQSAKQSVDSLRRLERALEGKYIDFRVNPLLDAMNFVFDREGQVLYKLHAKSTRVMGTDDERSMLFAKMQLEGREKYRLILVGEEEAVFDRDIKVEIFINENSGFRSKPRYLTSALRYPREQCNFEFDFDAPEVPTISDLRVVLVADQADHPIKVGMLFVRQRFHAAKPQERAQPLPRQDKPRSDDQPVEEKPPAPEKRAPLSEFRDRTSLRTSRVSREPDRSGTARLSRDNERDMPPRNADAPETSWNSPRQDPAWPQPEPPDRPPLGGKRKRFQD